ncbi:MAG: serine phosphatase [Acidimicrobiaceae bacterium]|nr:serine phosphatase [Acidimicrobiaceae bacterium]
MSWIRQHRFTVLAAIFLVAVLAADLLLERDQSVLSLLVLPPFLVALEWDWRPTAVTAALVVLVTATNLFGYDRVPSTVVALRVAGMVFGSLCAIYVSVERVRRDEVLAQSRAAVAAAQRAIIPDVPERLGHYGFTSLYRSAAQESLVGGDFFKVVRSPWGTRFILGDVEGKGLAAVSMSALVLGCFREWAPRMASVEELVAMLDERVHDYEERSAFVTAVVGSLDDDRSLELANCGHAFPLLFRGADATTLVPEHTTLPLGLGPKPSYDRYELQSGDRLFLYTDGLIETRTPTGGWVALEEIVDGVGVDSAETALAGVAARLVALGVPKDDLAMLLVEVA